MKFGFIVKKVLLLKNLFKYFTYQKRKMRQNIIIYYIIILNFYYIINIIYECLELNQVFMLEKHIDYH